ncbi:biotin/lipoyl-binding protein [Hazenella sp. IB182357]|uniref:Biotin/lipoyl-binding protein n=1 Tax=Polycladospora coralii TaxID=2771432 RepID=A0A926N828_9BACL|nr:biotin/lipoyl-containing protein [Polycladospora coralii]MBD1371303.1 biotin/lipoyl-binding protein [Polycladospora coralii]MBS7530271.1 biotin/lipoyl-binding protein [Polycladospora coralii]
MSTIQASMAGTIFKILVKEGERVDFGQDVVILESMKMEIPLQTEDSGIVTSIKMNEGDAVKKDQIILEIEGD